MINESPICGGASLETQNPATANGNSATNPASGPASPISNSARRDGIGDFILMNAPKVPARNSGGAGMKKGRRGVDAVIATGEVMAHLVRQ